MEQSNKIAFLEIRAQILALAGLKVKLPWYRHTGAPTHFQKWVEEPAGKLVSAHRPGVGTTHVWWVSGARCASGATGGADSVIHVGGASPAPGASVIHMGGASCSNWFY